VTTVAVPYSIDDSIYGFKFSVEGVKILKAYGGAAEKSSFTISSAGNIVIAYNLHGSSISPGTGVLLNLDIEGIESDCVISNFIILDKAL